jgi:lipopolysaccharide transport system ATP-binding protein
LEIEVQVSDPIIKVENLSKKYVISHQEVSIGNRTLRESISSTARSIGKKFLNSSTKETENRISEEFWALKNVSFEIKQGNKVGIIGRNGAGKSTLLKILSRITEPSQGRIEIKGRVASLLEVGTGFHPELSGRENVYLNGAILGMSKIEIQRKFDEIVAFAEIEKFLDTPVKRYSSGMYVRLAFAVAAHLEPEILIVDEVLAVGDSQFQKKCLGKMGEISEGGRTVIFVSHNMQAVRRLCSHAVYLEKGATKEIINLEDAINQYSKNVSMSNLDIELDKISRMSGFGEKARLLRLRLESNSSLTYCEPLVLIFTIQCYQVISDLAVGIGFETMDGIRVMTLDSDHDSPSLDIGIGIHEIKLELDRNPLHPSVYSINVAVLSNAHAVDLILNHINWEVLSSASDLVSDRGFGGCRLSSKVFTS